MRKFATLLLVLSFLSFKNSSSQCVLVPLSLEERVNASTLIVEAIVSTKTSYWNQDRSMIHTASGLLISKVYKGSELIQGKSVTLVTLGGTVGLSAIRVEPELETEAGEIGIFMLVNRNGEWISESGPQGMIRIDKQTAEASDVFNVYPAFSIEKAITALTRISPVSINELLTKIKFSNKRAFPTISSISPATITAGTSSVLTIKGANFEAARDTNSVQFRNADNGGTGFVKAMKYDYISWSDTMIKVMVRTTAGTGKIRVVVGGTGFVNSTDTLKVTYAHLNVVSGDSIGFETQEIGMNLANGITWKMNRRFYDSSGARGAFCRSLERWRCGTFINWDTLGRVNHSAIKPDGVNMCAWDTSGAMLSGVLAQCFSYWSGCFSGPNIKWFVNELDIRFRVKPTAATNWNYTTGNATSTQFHFESVATHELGHGHQMGHVINSPVVMHYSIANGQTKPALSANDISAGNYVISKSATAICGKNAHTKLNSGNCALLPPSSNFTLRKTSICKHETITYTDSSIGNISAYSWDFGAGASPATANTKGSHTVTYTTGGTKTVTLTVTTILGDLVKTKNAVVQNDPRMVSRFTYLAIGKGIVNFTNASTNPSSSTWYFGDGDTSVTPNPLHIYAAGGTYNVRLKATNTCETRDTTIPVRFAWFDFSNKFDACINEKVVFTDSSDNNVASWQWSFPGAIPATATGKGPHAVAYTGPGSKTVTLSVTMAGAPAQSHARLNSVSVGNDTFTKASFKFGYYGKNLVGFENNSEGSGMSFKWYFGDGDSSSSKNPLHQYANANNQIVRLLVKGNCGTNDTTIQLKDFTSLDPVRNALYRIYPNPADGRMFIENPLREQLLINICDLSGKLLIEETSGDLSIIDTHDLDNGVYLVKISATSGIENFRLVIQH
jgi:PKD repeat protein